MENQILKIKTPAGYIIVEKKGSEDDYPGIFVSFSPDGEHRTYPDDGLIACVEYDTESGRFLTETYAKSADEPVCITEYPGGEIISG